MSEDKDWFDTSKYMDSISIDFRRDFLHKHFLDLYQLKIKSQEIIEELPKFTNRSSIRSKDWQNRVQEEFEIFNLLKNRYIERLGFPVFDNLQTRDTQYRRWSATFRSNKNIKGKIILIQLGLTYPRSFPIAKKNLGDQHFTPGAKCFGDLKMAWDKNGAMGIPHFLVIVGYYYAIEKQSVRI
ncbi:MAG: hypothetical protein ACTSRG_00305 [Candidatus Helarchaeota archaeon]